MLITNDDQLRQVDARWLGVPGVTFPWRPTRYVAYAVGAPIVLITVFVVTRLIGTDFWPLVYSAIGGVVITTRLMRLVDDERPVQALLTTMWTELGTPRRGRHHAPAHSEIRTLIPIWAVTASDTSTDLIPVIARSTHVRPNASTAGTQDATTHDPATADRRTRRHDRKPWRRLVPTRSGALELPTRS